MDIDLNLKPIEDVLYFPEAILRQFCETGDNFSENAIFQKNAIKSPSSKNQMIGFSSD